jgi:hypothetical protein
MLRTPEGTFVQLGDEASHPCPDTGTIFACTIIAMAPNGEVMFASGSALYLGVAGRPPELIADDGAWRPIAANQGRSGDFAAYLSDHWVVVKSGVVYDLSEGPTGELPSLSLVKTASPSTVPETGGRVDFNVTVTNTGPADVQLTALRDDLYGDIARPTDPDVIDTSCSLPQTLASTQSYACTFAVFVSGNPWEDPIDTVTATAIDVEGNEASASDSATVDISQVHQRGIDVDRLDFDVSASGAEAAGAFRITNASDEPIEALVTTLDMRIEYRSTRTWAVTAATCSFDPSAPTVLSDILDVRFTCSLANPLPTSAKTVRVTALVTIDGRAKTFLVRATSEI